MTDKPSAMDSESTDSRAELARPKASEDPYAYTLFTSQALGLQRTVEEVKEAERELRQDIKSVENRLDRVEQEMNREMRHVILTIILSALTVIITVLAAVMLK